MSESMVDLINGTPDCPVGSPEWCAKAIDKIEGLEADLFLAVGTAYHRGAVEWTRRNYPEWFERLKVGGGQPVAALSNTEAREEHE